MLRIDVLQSGAMEGDDFTAWSAWAFSGVRLVLSFAKTGLLTPPGLFNVRLAIDLVHRTGTGSPLWTDQELTAGSNTD